jgi:hypothetical protein
MENLKEAVRLVGATQNRLWSAGKIDHHTTVNQLIGLVRRWP